MDAAEAAGEGVVLCRDRIDDDCVTGNSLGDGLVAISELTHCPGLLATVFGDTRKYGLPREWPWPAALSSGARVVCPIVWDVLTVSGVVTTGMFSIFGEV